MSGKQKWKLAALAFVLISQAPANAFDVVYDPTNYGQNVITAARSVQATEKQIQQYQTQLQQYEDEIKNTIAPSAYLWGQVNDTINGLLGSIDTLKGYKRQYGNLDNYLRNFQDTNYYRNSPCFSQKGCTQKQWDALQKQNELMSTMAKESNDAAVKGMDQQYQSLADDAARLKELQGNTQTSKGRMEAMQYANQLASSQASQLMQIRALLLAQQDVLVKHQQIEDNKKAQQEAADANFKAPTDFSKWNFPKPEDARFSNYLNGK